MSISIKTNVSSLTSQRNLGSSTARLTKAFTRLSSGLRINQASDDAAGLAIANQLRADSRIASVAIRNANDGVSIIAIADGALSQASDILTRMAELAEQSANGVFSNTQRSALANEFVLLSSEIDRISRTTEYNGLQILSGGAEVSFQIGFDGSDDSRISYSGVQGTLESIGLASVAGAGISFSIIANTEADSVASSRLALDAVTDAISSVSRSRGILGSSESRLITSISNLQVARENFQAAESRIRDVDVASEAAELARLQILQQAGASVLSQANQQPGLALSLLQG